VAARLTYHPDHSDVLIEVGFLLHGERFEMPKEGWAKLGKLEAVKESLRDYVDNVHLFECTWYFRQTARRVSSLDEVVSDVLLVVWPHRSAISKFRREKQLRVYLDCYVEYRADKPLINLESQTLKRMADLNCSIGLDVVQLPISKSPS
jgi:hypothetical protein